MKLCKAQTHALHRAPAVFTVQTVQLFLNTEKKCYKIIPPLLSLKRKMNFYIKRRKQDALALNLYVATGIGGHISSERKIKSYALIWRLELGGKWWRR